MVCTEAKGEALGNMHTETRETDDWAGSRLWATGSDRISRDCLPLHVTTFRLVRRADGCAETREFQDFQDEWPAPGSEDTELGVLLELEVGHGETEVCAGVQA